MTLEQYLKIFQRHWLALAVGLLAGLMFASLVTLLQPREYTADSSGFITTPEAEGVGMAQAGDAYAKSRAKSYQDLGSKRVVADAVIAELGLQTSPSSLVQHVTVTVPADTVTIQVSATSESPQSAADIANAWIRAMAAEIQTLESGAADTGAPAAAVLTPLESAAIPTTPSSPDIQLNLLIGGLTGLVLAAGYSVARALYDRRIRSVDSVTSSTEVPIIGTLPAEDALEKSESRLSPDQDSGYDTRRKVKTRAFNESLRDIRTNLEFVDVDNPPRSIVVTSPLPGEGKSTVTANLAVTIADADRTVVLIDGDLRKSTVASTFGLPGEVGLTDLLAGRLELSAVLHQWRPDKRLFILPSGSVPPNPSELLGSEAFKSLVAELVSQGATVIIDAPPVLLVTDAAVLAARCDGALAVASANKTRIDDLTRALDSIEKVRGRALGIVLNRVPTKGADRHYYGYYRGDYYAKISSTVSQRVAG